MSKTKSVSKKSGHGLSSARVRQGRSGQKVKTYEAYLLGLALIALVVGEVGLLNNVTPADLSSGLSILDISNSVSQSVSDVKLTLAPAAFAVDSINQFYEQSAVATTQLLDFSSPGQPSPMDLVYGVNDFYNMASKEVVSVLDLSNYMPSNSNVPMVAGASISR